MAPLHSHPPLPARRPVAGVTRRRVLMAAPLLAVAAHGRGAQASPALVRNSLALMGTRVDIVVEPSNGLSTLHAQQAIDAAQATMRGQAALMSRYDPASAVSRINALAGRRAVPVPPALMDVLRTAQALAVFTDGAFDITVGALSAWHFDGTAQRPPRPAVVRAQRARVRAGALQLDAQAGTAFLPEPGMAIDLGGVAKLPILAAGLETLRRHGVQHALVNGGGDVLVAGLSQGRPWRIGLRDPLQPERLLGTVSLAQGGVVASSGDYERYFWYEGRRLHHILDPHTGYPTTGLHGVALVAAGVGEVNGLGAAAMVKGAADAQAMLAQRPGIQALMVGAGGLWSTTGLQDVRGHGAHFTLQDGRLRAA